MTINIEELAVRPNDAIYQEVGDALYLLEHLLSSAVLRDDKLVDSTIVGTIKLTAALLGIEIDRSGVVVRSGDPLSAGSNSNDPRMRSVGPLSAADWIQFELAYGRLAVFAAPLTAQTLRDTADQKPGPSSWNRFIGHILGHSVAQRFTRWLWSAASLFAGLVVLTQWSMRRFGPVYEGAMDGPNTLLQLLEILTPYFYGGLGACVYLLRSAHQYIYLRTFDVHRRSEYFNRILLGTVSGGAIMLFVDRVTDDNGEVVTLSSAALGFLAGYSTDFLFSTIERIISAILPKVGLESVQRRHAVQSASIPSGDTTLSQLLDRHDNAKSDADKLLYRSLIEKFRDRM